MTEYKPKDLVLDHYHCTLFLPLIGLEKSGLSPKFDKHNYQHFSDDEGASYYYFSPTIRNILFDRDKQTDSKHTAIKEWRLPQEIIENWTITLDNSSARSAVKQNQQAVFRSVRLYQYYNGLYLLGITLEPSALATLRAKNKESSQTIFEKIQKNTLEEFNRIDPENIELYQQLIMENWLHFTRLIRLIYPSFAEQSDENKIAPICLKDGDKELATAFDKPISHKSISQFQEIGEKFSPVIFEILSRFFKDTEKEALKNSLKHDIQFYDDRMFVSVAYSIAGEQLPAKDLKRINSFVSYIDRREADGWSDMQGYAYTPEVVQNKLKQQSFALWQGIGGYYTFTGFSNSYLNRDSEFRSFIANEHIPHIYDRMLIQALFYQATLRHFDNEICKTTDDLLNDKINIKEIKKQRGDFIAFTNQYWFHKLTEQMQGKEIFELQQKGLGLQEHYEIIKDEIERTDEYLQVEHERKLLEQEKIQAERIKQQEEHDKKQAAINEEFNNKITFYGFIIGVLALYYAILPILDTAISTKTQTLWQKISCNMGISSLPYQNTMGLIIMLIILPIIFIGIFAVVRSLKNHNKA